MGTEATLGLADPARLAWALTPATSGARPPLHRGCALGGKLARDLGRGIGGEGEEVGRERERQKAGLRQPRGTPLSGLPRVGWPGPATPGGGTGPTARSSSGTV